MKNRNALVTGGMGGIGTEIAQHLAKQGARVAVTYNKGNQPEKATNWQKEQQNQGFDFKIYYVDVTDFDSCSKMMAEIAEELGKIDILVNNAGITDDGTLMKMSPNQWHKVINTNLNGVFNITRNVVPKMVEQNYGRIINISSVNGQKGQFGQTNYCATKAGIHGFTKALAQELAKKGITVNTVSPGYVKTRMAESLSTDILDKIIKQIPVGRLAEPREIARVVSFLASSESAYITGADLSINGGQHMH